ncbi:MAG: flagellar protein FlgN [Syntrophomonadaceae bacterium]|nr:flagellar protein FlgN [Syntrophomonadaceae bacterium]
MEKLIVDFINTIAKENGILENLVEFALEKQRYIILGKVQELDSLIRKEGIMISNLDRVEGARFKLQGKMASNWGVDIKEFNALEIMAEVKISYSALYGELEEALSRLDYNMVRLKALNTHNNELINQSLDYISVMESMLSGDVAGTYSQKGLQTDESDARPRLKFLDKKI